MRLDTCEYSIHIDTYMHIKIHIPSVIGFPLQSFHPKDYEDNAIDIPFDDVWSSITNGISPHQETADPYMSGGRSIDMTFHCIEFDPTAQVFLDGDAQVESRRRAMIGKKRAPGGKQDGRAPVSVSIHQREPAMKT
jgi:hypothetical protein